MNRTGTYQSSRSRTTPRAAATARSICPSRCNSRKKTGMNLAIVAMVTSPCMARTAGMPASARPGRQMKPFLRHLLSGGLSRKTLRRHRDNLWLLGGALIRDLHESPRLRKRPIDQVVLQALDEEGGPLISHAAAYDDQQRPPDATCRKFYRFLT